jgi:hypothetical protein
VRLPAGSGAGDGASIRRRHRGAHLRTRRVARSALESRARQRRRDGTSAGPDVMSS